jgi:hypothetical protein
MGLVPKAESYLDNELNVMLIGLHGVGKTEEILRLVRERGLKLKYYSCATLDPYTDLVGVPVPMKDEASGLEYLKMVRPRDIDDAEFIFFDEFNRADSKIHNAIFEIIQFGTINGEPLPNLKCCWAAMNPPGEDYQVEELDPALIDRFDVFVEVAPAPSVAYMSTEGGLPKPVAMALFTWWRDQNAARRGIEHYLSPRRLMKIGKVYMATGDADKAIPKWVTCDRSKLKVLLGRAEEDMKAKSAAPGATTAPSTGGANPAFTYDDGWMKQHALTVAKYLEDNQNDLDTHKAVLNVLERRHAPRLAQDYAEVLDTLKPGLLEGFIGDLNAGRLDLLKKKISELPDSRLGSLTNLKDALDIS